MLFLAAIFCFILAQQARWPLAWYAASVVCFWLSVASKEVGVVFPLVILWFDRVFVASSWREFVSRRWAYHLVTLGTLAAGAMFVLLWLDHYRHGGLLRDDLIPPLVYARHQAVAILRYLGLVVLPVGQCLDYAWRPTLTVWETLPQCIAVAGMLALTAWLAISRPPIGFLAGAFFLILAPTSSFAPIVDLIFEHRMYLPLAPLAVLAALGWRACSLQLSRRTGSTSDHWFPIGVAVIWVACLATAAHFRTEIYRTELEAWRDTVRKAPLNVRAHENLAISAGKQGLIDEAIHHYRAALRIQPDRVKSHQNLSELLVSTAPELAMNHAARAVALAPADRLLHNNLAVVLHACGREEEAITAAHATIETDPRWEVGHITLGNLLKDRSPAEAIGHLRRAIALNPASADAHNSLGILLASADDPEAVACFEAAVARDPNHAESWLNLATCHATRGRDAAAAACLRRALQLRPGWPQAAQNLRALESRSRAMEPASAAP
jgi:tetratricopeptide (TPR) repeat protein